MTAPATITGSVPYATLLSFTRYVGRTGGTYLNAVVDQVNARWKPLYESVVPGALRYLESLQTPVEVTPARDALCMIGSLPIKINPHFGLRYPDGHGEAVRLHFDEDPPQDEAAVATLHLMGRHMDLVLPNAVPVLVDVRRGDVLRPDPSVKPAEVERWLAGEAAAFSAMWGSVA